MSALDAELLPIRISSARVIVPIDAEALALLTRRIVAKRHTNRSCMHCERLGRNGFSVVDGLPDRWECTNVASCERRLALRMQAPTKSRRPAAPRRFAVGAAR